MEIKFCKSSCLASATEQSLLGTLFERLLLIVFLFLIDGRILVLLVFGNLCTSETLWSVGKYKIVHVALGFSEFHFVHTLTSIPMLSVSIRPVMVCTKKALRRNMALNCSPTRLKSSWIEVEFPMKVDDIFKPRGGTLQVAVRTLFGIHSTTESQLIEK